MGRFYFDKMACAVIHLTGAEDSGITGIITITQQAPDSEIEIKGEVSGLTAGTHGMQIREFGNFTDGLISAGAIFNPDCRVHGAPEDVERMAGDLGNIEVDEEGKAVIDMVDKVATLSAIDRCLLDHWQFLRTKMIWARVRMIPTQRLMGMS